MPDASFLSSDLFLLTLTVGLYCLGGAIYRRTRLPLLHPVLLTFVAVIVFLRCAGIGYARYQEATGVLNFALGMSVVALGYLLYEQLERLRGSLLPVGIATFVGCVAGVLSVVYIAMMFGTERQILTSIAPKSVTVPIAVSVSGPLYYLQDKILAYLKHVVQNYQYQCLSYSLLEYMLDSYHSVSMIHAH